MLPDKLTKDKISPEINKDKEEEKVIVGKTRRSREDIERIFGESYLREAGIEPGKEVTEDQAKKLIGLLTDRELANSKNLSKVIGQKRGYRSKLEAVLLTGKRDDDTDDTDDDEKKNKNEDKAIAVARRRGAKEELKSILSEFKDEGLDADEVYKNIRKHYSEDDEDITIEDFRKRVRTAFNQAYPKLHEESIISAKKRKEAEDEKFEGDKTGKSSTGSPKGRKTTGRRLGLANPKDWYSTK